MLPITVPLCSSSKVHRQQWRLVYSTRNWTQPTSFSDACLTHCSRLRLSLEFCRDTCFAAATGQNNLKVWEMCGDRCRRCLAVLFQCSTLGSLIWFLFTLLVKLPDIAEIFAWWTKPLRWRWCVGVSWNARTTWHYTCYLPTSRVWIDHLHLTGGLLSRMHTHLVISVVLLYWATMGSRELHERICFRRKLASDTDA